MTPNSRHYYRLKPLAERCAAYWSELAQQNELPLNAEVRSKIDHAYFDNELGAFEHATLWQRHLYDLSYQELIIGSLSKDAAHPHYIGFREDNKLVDRSNSDRASTLYANSMNGKSGTSLATFKNPIGWVSHVL